MLHSSQWAWEARTVVVVVAARTVQQLVVVVVLEQRVSHPFVRAGPSWGSVVASVWVRLLLAVGVVVAVAMVAADDCWCS